MSLLNWLQGKRVPTALAVPATILAALLVLGGVAVAIGGSVKGFTDRAPEYQERLETMAAEVQRWAEAHGIGLPEQLGKSLTELVKPSQAFNLIAGTLKGVAGALSNLFLVLLTIVSE